MGDESRSTSSGGGPSLTAMLRGKGVANGMVLLVHTSLYSRCSGCSSCSSLVHSRPRHPLLLSAGYTYKVPVLQCVHSGGELLRRW